MKNNNESIVILLGSKLKVAFVSSQESGDLLFDGTRLIDQKVSGFMGFHDWLRNKKLPRQVLGLRFWPHEISYLPIETLKNKDYISFLPNEKCVEVWFGASRDFDKEASGDQSFYLNRVIISTDQAQIALVLDLGDLSSEELLSVRSALDTKSASWI